MGWVATDPSTNPFLPVQMLLFVKLTISTLLPASFTGHSIGNAMTVMPLLCPYNTDHG